MTPVSFNELLILMLNLYYGEYFLSSIVCIADFAIEKNVGDIIMDESSTMAKSFLG